MALSRAWTDRRAVAETPALVQNLSRPDTFASARRLARAAEELEQRLQAEDDAELRDEEAERHAVVAQAGLLRALAARVEPAPTAARRERVAGLLRQWTDPYAEDATGRPFLDAARLIARGDEALAALVNALKQMRTAGRVRDQAAHRRACAIGERVRVREAWNDALEVLCTQAGVAPPTTCAVAPDLSSWFAEE